MTPPSDSHNESGGDATPDPGADAPRIPGYRIDGRLGRGGMATVWLALQLSLDRQVAIKVMSPEALADEMAKQRFEHEARTIAKLEHPGIVGIHEVGRTEGGQPYYVMPYLARGALSPADHLGDETSVLDTLRALLSALEYAHARGVVHRDVKTENVLLDASNRPRLTDFGIALSKRNEARITTAGLALGSGGYMSPEQARGEEVDGRADLYSLGVLAYELLTGELPFDSGEALALALMHAQDPVPRLPGHLAHWQEFIDTAMAKEPAQRYRSASQMLRALERLRHAHQQRSTGERAIVGLQRHALARAHLLKPGLLFVGGLAGALLLAWGIAALLPADGWPGGGGATPVVTERDTEEASDDTDAAGWPAGTDEELAAGEAAADEEPTEVELPLADLVEAGQAQLAAGQLLSPADANAADTWQHAWSRAPDDGEVVAGLAATLAALGRQAQTDLERGRDGQARAAYARARELAAATEQGARPEWRSVREAVVAELQTRMQRALNHVDRAAGDAAAGLAEALEPGHPDLRTMRTAISRLPALGQPVAGGPPMTLVAVGAPGRPALAAMTRPVTVAEYRAFATATSRSAANCHLPASLVRVFARRTWDAPPFDQTPDHPVVCVSHDDAESFGSWLSGRTGLRLHLPTTEDWNRMVEGTAPGQCATARLKCGDNRGTIGVARFQASRLGLRDLNGNVSEWLRNCAGDCGRRLAAGQSWRDEPGEPPTRTSDHPAERGHEYIGFRLVRELRPGDSVEIAQ